MYGQHRKEVIADVLFTADALRKMRTRVHTDISEAFKPSFRKYDTDATTNVEIVLAGYDETEIKVTLNLFTHKLSIKASHADKYNNRDYSSEIPLHSHVKPEDISVNYKNGILTVSIAHTTPTEKEEHTVSIPVNNS